MIRGNLKKIIRAMIPAAKTTVVSDELMDLIIEAGVVDIAAYTCCLKGNSKFDATLAIEYKLSTVLPKYLAVDKSGLWWYNGSIWRPVYPKTLKWLDDNAPNWRSAAAGSPMYYSIDSDTLTVYPKAETALSDGFWLYFGEKPNPMTSDEQYPFSGTTTEYAHLSIFDMAIIKYAKWQIEPMVNEEVDSEKARQEYYVERDEKMNLLYTRRDIRADNDTKLRFG